MQTATISSKYQLVIPKQIREAIDLRPGERLGFVLHGRVTRGAAGERASTASPPRDGRCGGLRARASRTSSVVDFGFALCWTAWGRFELSRIRADRAGVGQSQRIRLQD